jgi:hypothetical protein
MNCIACYSRNRKFETKEEKGASKRQDEKGNTGEKRDSRNEREINTW